MGRVVLCKTSEALSVQLQHNDSEADLYVDDCGHFGTCIEGMCQCDKFWSQSDEFDFYEPLVSKRGLLCDTNVLLIRALYSLNALVALSAIYLQLRRWNLVGDRWSQLCLFLGTVLQFAYSVCRLIETENPLYHYGNQLFPTGLSVVGIFLMYLACWMFINRYIGHEEQRIIPYSGKLSSQSNIERRAVILKYCQFIFLLIGFLSGLLLLLLSFIRPANQKEVALSAIILLLITTIYVLCVLTKLLSSLIKQVESMIQVKQKELLNNDCRVVGVNVLVKLRQALPKTRMIRLVIFVTCLCQLGLTVPTIFSLVWSRCWKYFLPIYSTEFIIANLIVRKQFHQTLMMRSTLDQMLAPRTSNPMLHSFRSKYSEL